MKTRVMISHTDCRNCFAECERSGDAKLYGEPIGILSNNDGAIVSRSKELKDLGIPMAAAPFEYKDILAANKVHLFSSNYELYGPLSMRVFNIGSKYSPIPFKYSIDEFFAKHFDYSYDELHTHLQKMGREIRKKTSLPTSTGCAPTMALAKIATSFAKDFPKYNDVCIIDTIEKRDKALQLTPVKKIWGIGSRQAIKLKRIGILTAYDFITKTNDTWVRKHLTVVGLRLKEDLKGNPAIFFEKDQPKKGIKVSRSFALNTDDYGFIKERVATYANWASQRLREEGSHTSLVTLQMATAYYKENEPQNFDYFEYPTYPTNSSIQIVKCALKALEIAYKPGFNFKKVEVHLGKITPAMSSQTKIFDGEKPKEIVVMKVMDKLNGEYGREVLKLGSQDMYKRDKSRISNLSPRYMTRWDELLKVNCTGGRSEEVKEELQIGAISNYAPYGLQFCNKERGSSPVLKQLVAINYQTNHILFKGETSGRKLNGNWVPVLNPIENLGLKQLLNDEYFIPLNKLGINYIDFKKILERKIQIGNLLTFDEMQLLYKWHFDVNGLIKKGLAMSNLNLKIDPRN